MSQINIIGGSDPDRLYCTGSFSKLMTTFVSLSFLTSQYYLEDILQDVDFLTKIAKGTDGEEILTIFEKHIGSRFSLRDVCSFYNGLPYTFDITPEEIDLVEEGRPLKHHSVMNEEELIKRCRHSITQMDPNRAKFHYSELAIIFLGYFIEKVFDVCYEDLYQKYVIDAFGLTNSLFSRIRPPHVYCRDYSEAYDYPSIAILDHGYFCYSNGFFTTLNDHKNLIEHLLESPVFQVMSDIRHARAASNTIMNGLAVEIRIVGDDSIYGYEGLSYSGCNIWAYSTKLNRGYITLIDSEEAAYDVIYGALGYQDFDRVPEYTQKEYRQFFETHRFHFEEKAIPAEYVGNYHRVNINESFLPLTFSVSEHAIEIRNPDRVKYDVVYDNGVYRTKTKDGAHGIKVGFVKGKANHYMYFDGALYRKIVL